MTKRTDSTSTETLSAGEARSIALAAQGFGDRRPAGGRGATVAAIGRVAERILIFQIDPINVLVRSQYLPAFARAGDYDMERLDSLCYERHDVFEYVGHEWSMVAVELHPLLRWRMAAFAADWRWVRDLPSGYADDVLREVEERGAMTPSELAAPGTRGGRFEAKPGKRATHWLTQAGELAVAGRRGLQQVYDLTERVIPERVLNEPTPEPDDARRQLLLRSAQALGVGTAKDIVSYFLLGMGVAGVSERVAYPKCVTARKLVGRLADDGQLRRVAVDGWSDEAFIHPGAAVPSEVRASALLSPFDSLVWERERTERLFGFRYRSEIYTKPADREFGYYVLPVLLGDSLVGRLDVKSDRDGRKLAVIGSFAEESHDPAGIADDVAAEVTRMAGWLGLDGVRVDRRGNLATALRAAIGG